MINNFLKCTFLSLLCAPSVLCAQNYSGSQSYGAICGKLEGTEKYNYVIDEQGDKLVNGTYSFSAQQSWSNENYRNMKAKYTLTAVTKEGQLNGTYSQSASYTGTQWRESDWSWNPYNESSKLTGIFLNGEPSGLFTCVRNTEDPRSKCAITATLKNGLYVGNYSYDGNDKGYLTKLSGTLTSDGKLTGEWIYEKEGWFIYSDKNKEFKTRKVFENDVEISTDNGKKVTPPALQQLAKNYSKHLVSKEELQKENVFVFEDSLPLNILIDDFMYSEHGLKTIPAKYSFKKYNQKKYEYLVKLNTFTEEGLKIITKFIEEKGTSQSYFGKNSGGESTMCYTKLSFDDQYKCHYLTCNEEFANQYAMIPNSKVIYIIGNDLNLYNKALETYELNQIKSQAKPFAEFLTDIASAYCKTIIKSVWNGYANSPQDAMDILSKYSDSQCKDLREDFKRSSAELMNAVFKCDSTLLEYKRSNYIYWYETNKYCFKDIQRIISLISETLMERKIYWGEVNFVVNNMSQSENPYYKALIPSVQELQNRDDYIVGRKELEKIKTILPKLDELDSLTTKIRKQCEPYPVRTAAFEEYMEKNTITKYQQIGSLLSNIDMLSTKFDQIEQLNEQILGQCVDRPKCTKAYNILYQDITIGSLEDAEQAVALLEKLKQKFSTEDMKKIEKKVKKVKTGEDVKILWEL